MFEWTMQSLFMSVLSKWRFLSYWSTGLQPREYNNITIIICNCSLFFFFLFDAAKPFQQSVICRVLVVARRQMLQLVSVRKYAPMCVCPLFVVIVFDLANWHLWLTVLHPGSISLPRFVRDLFCLKWHASLRPSKIFVFTFAEERKAIQAAATNSVRTPPAKRTLRRNAVFTLYDLFTHSLKLKVSDREAWMYTGFRCECWRPFVWFFTVYNNIDEIGKYWINYNNDEENDRKFFLQANQRSLNCLRKYYILLQELQLSCW